MVSCQHWVVNLSAERQQSLMDTAGWLLVEQTTISSEENPMLNRKWLSPATFCSTVALACTIRVAPADEPSIKLPFPVELSAEQFTRYQTLIRPAAHELPWVKISWHASVWEARKQAAAEGKPILIWAGGGSPPLGVC